MEDLLPAKPQRRIPLIAAAAIATVATLGVGAYAFTNLQGNSNKVDLSKLTVVAQAEDITLRIAANGSVIPSQTVNLSPKSSGRVARIFVEQGDVVRQGQKIAQMENSDLQAQLLQSQANVRQAQANLAKLQNGSRPEDIAQSQARLDAAQASLDRSRNGNRSEEINQVQARLGQAQANLNLSRSIAPQQIQQSEAQLAAATARRRLSATRLERFQGLFDQGAITRDRLDEAIADSQTTTASYLEAQQRLQQVRNNTTQDIAQKQAVVAEVQQNLQQQRSGSRSEDIRKAEAEVRQAAVALQQVQKGARPEEIAQLKAALEAAQAQLLGVQVQLRETTIIAPFDGIITQRYANEGAFVTPTTTASKEGQATSTSVVAIAQNLEVRVKVPEVDIGKVQTGQQVEISVDAYPEDKFQGTVKIVAPEAVVEQNVTAFDVRLSIDNDGQSKLKSGMNVNVNFLGRQVPAAILVPTVAIVRDKGKDAVLIPGQDNQPELREVTLGFTVRDKTQVTTGLQSGQRVFIDTPKGFKLNKDRGQ
jgi:HlyD family secretion protein